MCFNIEFWGYLPLIFIIVAFFLLSNTGYSQCEPISVFPWIEGFEGNFDTLPPCWTQGSENFGHWDYKQWSIVSNQDVIGQPSIAHSGNYKVIISLDCYSDTWHRKYLISPIFDLSGIEKPTLNFWYSKLERASLTIAYKNLPEQPYWIHLINYQESTLDWQKITISLPDKSNHYQIAFLGNHAGGGYGELQIDDISISDGELEL